MYNFYTDLKNKIFILDDVLSESDCTNLIEYYNNHGCTHIWNGTYPMTIDLSNRYLKTKVGIIESLINRFLNNSIEVEWCEVVKWPPGTVQNLHHDTSSPATVFTSITYLNVDYSGGRTYIKDDIEIVPKIGRTVYFDGKHYLHGVTPVLNNTRYTLPIWYKGLL